MSGLQEYVRFLRKPRKYLSGKLDERLTEVMEKNFLIPIDNTGEQDVFIVGYPKSGNTWMQSIISGLVFGIDARYLPDMLAQEIVPDVHARTYYKRFSDVCYFKSHNLPREKFRRVIYIVRDGRDALASYFHFNQKIGNAYTVEEMVKEGAGMFPSKWHEHVRKWLENPFHAEILYVRYEDLLTQPIHEMARICEFLGIARDKSVLERVHAGNTFEQMREKARKYGGVGHKNWTGEKGVQFFRKGKTGDYRNLLTSELIEFFNGEARHELEYFKYI